jgi:hypothetical protein
MGIKKWSNGVLEWWSGGVKKIGVLQFSVET